MHYNSVERIQGNISLAFAFIYTAQANTKTLVKYLHVSRPTVTRIVNELRRRGYKINSVRDSTGWHYEVTHFCGLQLPSIGVLKIPDTDDNNVPDNPDNPGIPNKPTSPPEISTT